ncbi:hypothetical protein H8D79_00650, partial [PVC group bacterium]|nr:hypothetical protein [PVC group bacterium]
MDQRTAATPCLLLSLLIALHSHPVSAQCRLSKTGDLSQPEGRLVLENQFIRLELSPARGGRATRLLCKPAQKELVHLASTSAAPQGVGLLLDVHRRLWELPYEWEVVEETESRVAVRFSRTATIGRQRKSKIRVRKTIDVQEGRNSVLVRYELSNAGDETALLSFRLTNIFSPGGPKAPARDVSFPYGVRAEKRAVNVSSSLARRHDLTYYLKSEASINHWAMEPSQSWTGVRDPSGLGVGMEVDFPHVDVLYSWFPSTQGGTGFPTAEVFYRPVELRPFKADPDEVVLDPSLRGNVFR